MRNGLTLIVLSLFKVKPKFSNGIRGLAYRCVWKIAVLGKAKAEKWW